MNQQQRKYWRDQCESLKKLYRKRIEKWQRLIELYDLEFNGKIRDLPDRELVKVSRFYPLTRQVIATIAYNYPKMFVQVEDEEGDFAANVLERAAAATLKLTNAREHVHQQIFDALYCTVGWLAMDYNPPGDDAIAPYVTNDSFADDFIALNRRPPGHVWVDPMTPPHMLSQARYIIETLWVPLKYLRDDNEIQNRRQIKATSVSTHDPLTLGEVDTGNQTPEMDAQRDAIESGEFVQVRRVHDRMERKQYMLIDDMEEPIQEIDHPFTKMDFPQIMGSAGPIMDEDGEPMRDLNNGTPAPGFLVEGGFPLIPLKFDLHGHSFYPEPPMRYVEDLQKVIVESVSRQANLLKRAARQGLVSEREVQENPSILDDLRKGEDGQWHKVQDTNNFKELQYGSIPAEQYALEDRARGYEEQTLLATEMERGGGPKRTATEASIIAAGGSINREWMQAKVSRSYEQIVGNAFRIFGDPRYTPKQFILNVAPDGQQALRRALTAADFLWTFHLEVKTGSTSPMVEQLEREDFLDFYDRAIARPSFDPIELDKRLASAFGILDVERLLLDDLNGEAIRAAQLENDRIISQLQDPGVTADQDHQTHIETHASYKEHPVYAGLQGQPQLQQLIDQIMAQHIQQHQAALAQEQQGLTTPKPTARSGAGSLIGQVQSNAQKIENQVTSDAVAATEGA